MILTVPPGLFDDGMLSRLGDVAREWLEDDSMKVLIIDQHVSVEIIEDARVCDVDEVYILARAEVRVDIKEVDNEDGGEQRQ